jgi:hypothetical protein
MVVPQTIAMHLILRVRKALTEFSTYKYSKSHKSGLNTQRYRSEVRDNVHYH